MKPAQPRVLPRAQPVPVQTPVSAPSEAPTETASVPEAVVAQSPAPAVSAGSGNVSRAFRRGTGLSRANLPVSVPPPSGPASMRLEVGTAVWIRLNSVTRRPGGAFIFRGTLVLPVNALEGGTQVGGTGIVSKGQTSLVVQHFVRRGVIYELKSPAGGSGKTVSFEAGHVLELFLSSTSIYERPPH